MKNFALIGKKLGHTISPFLHTEIARLYKHSLNYSVQEMDDETHFIDLINKIKNEELNGVNITIPYKVDALKYVDSVSEHAQTIGAINTLYLSENKVIGTNTDYDGFLGLVKHHNIQLNNKSVLILGTGGAAKAAYKVCEELKAKIHVATRSKENQMHFENLISYNEIDDLKYDIIINATPVGMFPYPEDMPLKENQVTGKVVIDLVYNPLETKLMSKSSFAVNGIDMLIIQAIKAQSLWFNTELPFSKETINYLRGLCHEYIRDNF